MTEKLTMHTRDQVQDNVEKIAELFPNCVTESTNSEGKTIRAIDFEALKRQLSNDIIEEGKERYVFTWPGKSASQHLANVPSTLTLRVNHKSGMDSSNFETTKNVYIEGDNLEALKLLRETYLHRIRMIYIDPPYNTGNNLIYHNDFTQTIDDYLQISGQMDEDSNRLYINPETNGRFHTDWLNMMYPRLLIAKDLLMEDGLLVCAMDENELDTLSLMLKDIFGESIYDHVCVSVVHNPRGQQGLNFSHTNEYAIFVFQKGKKIVCDRKIDEENVDWSQFRNWGGESLRTDAKNCFYPVIVKNGTIIGFGDVSPDDYHPDQTVFDNDLAYVYPIDKSGVERKWRYARQTVDSIKNLLRAKRTVYGFEIEIGKTFGVQRTIWSDKRYDANEYGTKIINELCPNSGFSFPKSLWTVYDSIYAGMANDKNGIVLDFFSGSATTAHATMELNANDGGSRRFILVQYPEKIDSDSESYKSGYNTICDIGRRRIVEAAKRVKENHPEAKFDGGFRSFYIDSSNMTDIYYRPDTLKKDILDYAATNIKTDRSGEDLLFQVMLELGIELSAPIERSIIAGKEIFTVDNEYLIACFDDNVTDVVVTEIAKKKPRHVVFRDSSMADDSVAINFEQIFKAYSPNTKTRVL